MLPEMERKETESHEKASLSQSMRYSAAYARQSVEKKDSISIASQIAFCRSAAGGQELKIYQDAGYSGKNTARPAFQQLLQDIQADRICALYVYRLDRFSRSIADFGRLWEILKEHGVEFVSVSENFDTTSPMGCAMLHIIMVFAQLERDTTAERVRDNYYRRVALGAWPGGPAPYGFSVGTHCGREGRRIPTLIPDGNKKHVLRIYREYAEKDTSSLRQIAGLFLKEQIPGPTGGGWDSTAVSRILHNPVYVMADEEVRLYCLAEGAVSLCPAEAFDGKHGLLAVRGGKAGRNYSQMKHMQVSVLNSVGIVPPELWLACQEKLAKNRQIGNAGKGRHSWLSGKMKCAKCGYSLSVAAQGEKRWLICSGRYHKRCCDAKVELCVESLEAAVAAELEDLLVSCPVEQTMGGVYRDELADIDRRAARLTDAFAESNGISIQYLQQALERLEQERKHLLDLMQRERSGHEPDTQKAFGELDFDEKKEVVSLFVEKILVDGSCAEIRWTV